jgi:hypothetical protein
MTERHSTAQPFYSKRVYVASSYPSGYGSIRCGNTLLNWDLSGTH